MQKFLPAAAVLAMISFSACNNSARKPGDVVIKSEDGKTQAVINTTDMQKAGDQWTKKSEELAKLTPYSTDELKALTPEEFGGTKRSSYNAQNAMGVAMVEAKYKVNDTASYELNIIDCAGAAGSGFFGMQYLSLMNVETESEEKEAKSIDWNGSRAYQEYDKISHDSKLTWLAGDRVLVSAEGRNISLNELKGAAKNLVLPIK